MNITNTIDPGSMVIQGIERMNKVLSDITSAQLGLDTKMMKASVIAQVTGQGQNFDASA